MDSFCSQILAFNPYDDNIFRFSKLISYAVTKNVICSKNIPHYPFDNTIPFCAEWRHELCLVSNLQNEKAYTQANRLSPVISRKETNMERLEGKVAIVTGASGGIGAATARLFAREGAKVVVADMKVAEGREVAEDIKLDGGEATFISLDVTKESDWQDLISKTIEKYGKLNILVNNAGVSLGKRIAETSLEDWNWVMDVNATGVFLGTKYAIETMKDNGELCSIINRSSVAAMIGEPELPAYCASKGAVRSFTKSAALTCGEAGYKIRVNSVHPGYVPTKMTEKEARDLGMPPGEYFEKVGEMHPIGHIGDPTDIAYGDLYLASDESKWVTGSELVIDGGYSAK